MGSGIDRAAFRNGCRGRVGLFRGGSRFRGLSSAGLATAHVDVVWIDHDGSLFDMFCAWRWLPRRKFKLVMRGIINGMTKRMRASRKNRNLDRCDLASLGSLDLSMDDGGVQMDSCSVLLSQFEAQPGNGETVRVVSEATLKTRFKAYCVYMHRERHVFEYPSFRISCCCCCRPSRDTLDNPIAETTRKRFLVFASETNRQLRAEQMPSSVDARRSPSLGA